MLLSVRGGAEQSVRGAGSFGGTAPGRAYDCNIIVDEARLDDVDDIGGEFANRSACICVSSHVPRLTFGGREPYHQTFEQLFPSVGHHSRH